VYTDLDLDSCILLLNVVWIDGNHDLGIWNDEKDAVHIQELPECRLHRFKVDIKHVRASPGQLCVVEFIVGFQLGSGAVDILFEPLVELHRCVVMFCQSEQGGVVSSKISRGWFKI